MPLYANRCKAGGSSTQALPIINASLGGAYEKKAAAGSLDVLGAAQVGEIIDLYADEDGFVSFGVAPNAATDAFKFFIPAKTARSFAVQAGHKVAWNPGT